jgi:hypothetical protein
MSKPNITEVNTTQTFQNWLDKTNEMVQIFKNNAMTASGSGDSTTGDATLVGDFTANTVVVFDELQVDDVTARTAGGTIDYTSPVKITGSTASVVATFQYNASGGRTRYTNGAYAWDIGMDNSTDTNFIMNSQSGEQFKLSPNGVLTIPSIVVTSEITFPTSNGAATGTIEVANADISDTLTANTVNAVQINCNDIRGNLYGDIFTPDGTKVFENGPGGGLPATFTGNVLGTVSSLTNHTTNVLDEGTDNRVGESSPGARDGGNNLYFTDARARAALSGSTGVTYNTTTGAIAIGQSVGTSANVRFQTVTASGDVTAFASVSDIAMKENINPIENALDKVMQLGGYTFNYKSSPDEEMTGVMAQEIQKVLPGIVYETTDPITGKETYAVRHGNLVGLLIEAIKELSAKVGK